MIFFFKSSWVTLPGHQLREPLGMKAERVGDPGSPRLCCRGKNVPDEPLPASCQGPASALAPGVCARNVELGTLPGTWHCCFLLSAKDPHSLTRQLESKKPGCHWGRLAKPAKRMPRGISLAHRPGWGLPSHGRNRN